MSIKYYMILLSLLELETGFEASNSNGTKSVMPLQCPHNVAPYFPY